MQSLWKRQIALPQEHGAWVFLLSPLFIGLFAAATFPPASLLLVMAALSAFLLRQPVTVWVKIRAGRRPASELPIAQFWAALYGLLLLVFTGGLLYNGYTIILLLALPAGPVFGWHLWLVSRRAERRQAGLEIVAAGVLALAAPAALWVGRGVYDPAGWLLWMLTWLQSAASIVHAYLRLEQREWKSVPDLAGRLRAGSRALAYTSFNLLVAIALGVIHQTPMLLFVPYLLQFGETVWGTLRPAQGARPTAIGLRQLLISTMFTFLFILAWREP